MEPSWIKLAAAAGGLALGALVCWLWMRSAIVAARIQQAGVVEREAAAEQERQQLQRAHEELKRQADGWRTDLDAIRDERAQLAERASRVPQLEQQAREALAQFTEAQASVTRLAVEVAQLRATLEAERQQLPQQLARLDEARVDLSNHFKALASEILEEKSKSFSEVNQASLGTLLNPLRERMTEFKAKVEEIHAKDLEQQATLKAELAQLRDLNRQITEEAHGLAVALKGQSKVQGNWGELVLGNVLDRAGLCEGKDYRREVSFDTEEGRRRPDVVLSLPQNKHLVIDAKVSLNAYTRYVNAEEPLVREQALREHVAAIGARIQELADRRYFELPGLNTPEMVFMFIPIESAFVEALRADESLFQRAIERNILVATPTTLLTSLNIVRQLWRFEEQNAHTAALADRAAKVYAKLATFVGSMEAVGKQLDRARETYGTAMGQLVNGKNNLIQQAKDFEKLGVAVKAQLPAHLVEKAALELDYGTVVPIEYLPAGEAPAA
ncbi:MAG TPA: DNA recombination protein RmuC [Ramlibacter sp.]|nr:DNA recombination protein RmuC [Ramlibacter sp.]